MCLLLAGEGLHGHGGIAVVELVHVVHVHRVGGVGVTLARGTSVVVRLRVSKGC
jgi:hypothetical protein